MRAVYTIAVILTLEACLLLHHLGGVKTPSGYRPFYIHDECYQAFTAHRYVLGDAHAWGAVGERATLEERATDDLTNTTTYEWVHPPTAKLAMAGLIAIGGFRPFVFRLGSVLCGLLAIAGAFFLAHRLYGRTVATWTAVLLCMDGLFFVMSRTAMNDIYATAALVWTAYALWRAYTEDSAKWIVLTGALAGLALTIKWNTAPFVLCAAAITAKRAVDTRRIRVWFASFIALPPAIYLASYAPYFALGHDVADLAALTRDIIAFHQNLVADHSSSSRWYEWPLMIRPVWFSQIPGATLEETRDIFAFGTPLLWWAFVPAVLGSLSLALIRRTAKEAVPALAFFAIWLPWAAVSRVSFIQYLLPAVPFAIMSIARFLVAAWSRGRALRLWAAAYALACALCFLNLQPILTGRSTARSALASSRFFWLEAWRPCVGGCAKQDDSVQLANGESTPVLSPGRSDGRSR